MKVTRITTSSILKPLVHFIRVPDAIDVCLTGNEKVKPSSLCLPGGGWNSSGSELTNFARDVAIKSNNSCNDRINIFQGVGRLIASTDFLITDLPLKNWSSNEEESKLLWALCWQHLSLFHLTAHEGCENLCHQDPMHKRFLSHPYKMFNKVKNDPKGRNVQELQAHMTENLCSFW